MSGERLQFSRPDFPDLVVKAVVEEDMESLRAWKNANRDRFFFTDVITQEMQQEWFRAYLSRPHDFMFVVMHGDERVGCLGFRRQEDRVDFYNIIVDPRNAQKGYMSCALDVLCDEARRRFPQLPVMVSVLRSNPAMDWYLQRGFSLTAEYETYLDLTRTADRSAAKPEWSSGLTRGNPR